VQVVLSRFSVFMRGVKMKQNEQLFIVDLEKKLWNAADKRV